ncbi:MAG: ATP-grasp domain-containing protein [Bradymonadia bacterium]
MAVTSAIVQSSIGDAHFDQTEKVVIAALKARGMPYIEGTEKLIRRKRLLPTPETLVAGSIPMVHAALQALGITPPPTDDYPQALRGCLHRKVWRTRLRDPSVDGCFVKPVKLKKFTGRVLHGRPDPFYFGGGGRNTEIWASDVVEWVSEYRCFVAHGHLLGHRWYSGDTDVDINLDVVREAIALHTEAPWGYALDFGVLSTGETALVEYNQGYSLGDYGLDPELYLQVLEAFWNWAMTTR